MLLGLFCERSLAEVRPHSRDDEHLRASAGNGRHRPSSVVWGEQLPPGSGLGPAGTEGNMERNFLMVSK